MVKKPEGISIECAVALHLQTRSVPCTAKQCMEELLLEVKKLTGNHKLTISNIKENLRKWLDEGWAIISKKTLQVTRAGRKKIKELADAALASPTPAAA